MCTSDESFLLTNVRLLDHPVVYCSSGFTELTGWSRRDVLRRPVLCSMMHGPVTDDDDVARMRHALQSDVASEPFEIVFYTTNGQCHNGEAPGPEIGSLNTPWGPRAP